MVSPLYPCLMHLPDVAAPGKGVLLSEAAPAASEANRKLMSGGCLLATVLQQSVKAFPAGWVGRLIFTSTA